MISSRKAKGGEIFPAIFGGRQVPAGAAAPDDIRRFERPEISLKVFGGFAVSDNAAGYSDRGCALHLRVPVLVTRFWPGLPGLV
jgi:hypothetical protein